MKVKIVKRVGVRGKTAMPGDVVELPNDEARRLVVWGDAVVFDEPPEKPAAEKVFDEPPEKPAAEKPKRKYTRRKKKTDA